MVPHVSLFVYMGLQKCGVVVVGGGGGGDFWGDYSSLTAALIDLIFGKHTPIKSIGVVDYMNLNFEVIKGHLWEIFTKTSDVSRSFWIVKTFFSFTVN